MTDLILVNAKVTTLDRENPEAQAVAIRDGKFLTVGSETAVRAAATPDATVIDAGNRRIIPSHFAAAINTVVIFRGSVIIRNSPDNRLWS